MKQSVIVILCVVGFAVHLLADEPVATSLKAPKDWSGERITLPPSFAKDMQLKGTEVIRFAPGMFDPAAASFFSYVIVFQVEPQPTLTKAVLQRELLAYYRGLATAVGKPKKPELDVDEFSFQLQETKSTRKGASGYTGVLKWVEPFRTLESQKLMLEVDTWDDAKTKQALVFMVVSPAKKDTEIWQQMREIRKRFFADESPE